MLTGEPSLFWFLSSLPSESKLLVLVHFYHLLWCAIVLFFWLSCKLIKGNCTDPERVEKYFVLVFPKWIFISICCVCLSSLTCTFKRTLDHPELMKNAGLYFRVFSEKQIASLPFLCLSTVNKTVEIGF